MKTLILLLNLFVITNCSGISQKAAPTLNITTDNETATKKIDSLMKAYDFYNRFSGTLLIANKDIILYKNSFGYADYTNNLKNTNKSIYGIGSCTKQFTANAILKLIDDGKITLEDKLSKYFPNLGVSSKKISIENLLTHSSGISQDIGRGDSWDKILFPQATPISIDSLIHIFGELKLQFTPGNKFDYNNFNYILLAGIIKKVSGEDYRSFLKDAFWHPLQMNSTDFNQLNIDKTFLSKPHNDLPNSYNPPPFWDDSWGIGAGGIYSSVDDLYLWHKKLKQAEVLSKESTNLMFQLHIEDGDEHYGFGWQIAEIFWKKYIYHDGGTNGYYCKVGFLPTEEIYVVILSNHTHNLRELDNTSRMIKEINTQIYNIFFDCKFIAPPIPKQNTSIDFAGNVKINEHTFTVSQSSNNHVTISAIDDSYSFMDIPFIHALSEGSERFKKVETIVKAFGEKDFTTILNNSTFMLRTLISKEIFAEIWTDLAGELISWNCYKLPTKERENDYFVRMIFEKKEIGLQLCFKGDKINGMFTDKSFSFNGPETISCVIIDKNRVFIDGFKYGYPDGLIFEEDNILYVEILNQKYKIEKN